MRYKPEAVILEQVREIAAHMQYPEGDGKRIVELLLSGRRVDDLSTEELQLLSKGYNWSGRDREAFDVAYRALERRPNEVGWWWFVRDILLNLFINAHWEEPNKGRALLIEECNRLIGARLGHPAFWHLVKADYYVDWATGELEEEDYTWEVGSPIRHPEGLAPAAGEMEAALAIDPTLRSHPPDWAADWNSRFAAVLQFPEFRFLALGEPIP